MKVFITGATGYIGRELLLAMAGNEIEIHALYRSETKIENLKHPKIILFKGDLQSEDSLSKAMNGCRYVIHLAAYAKVWAKSNDLYRKINYEGTRKVLDAAIQCKVEKVIVVSTAGVFGPSVDNKIVDETTQRAVPFFSEYEKSKEDTDKFIIKEFAPKLKVVIVCPTRVFGPGELSESNAVTKIIKAYLKGRFRFLPGSGKSIGNYVFISDVIKGIQLAIEKGESGERYILGGENVSFIEFFTMVSKISGKNYRMYRIPTFLIIAFSYFSYSMAKLFGIYPVLTPGWARKYLHNWHVSSAKAVEKLGYSPKRLSEGLDETVKWLQI